MRPQPPSLAPTTGAVDADFTRARGEHLFWALAGNFPVEDQGVFAVPLPRKEIQERNHPQTFGTERYVHLPTAPKIPEPLDLEVPRMT